VKYSRSGIIGPFVPVAPRALRRKQADKRCPVSHHALKTAKRTGKNDRLEIWGIGLDFGGKRVYILGYQFQAIRRPRSMTRRAQAAKRKGSERTWL